MHLRAWILRGIGLGLVSVFMLPHAQAADPVDDPYLWLEDIHGEKPLAWVKEQNAHSLGILQADPSYQKDYDALLAILDASDRIPYPSFDHQSIFNFWQDAQNPKGLLRSTTLPSYLTPAPVWETVLDIDQLSAAEHENWVYEGTEHSPSLKYALVTLSPGGGDAHVIREFDLAAKKFLPAGFQLPSAKCEATYLDDDTVLFATDFGPGTLTKSGYPRLIKLWRRGTPLSAAQQVFAVGVDDVDANPFALTDSDGLRYGFVSRDLDAFNSEVSALNPDGTTTRLPLPQWMDVDGLSAGSLIVRARKPWTVPSANGANLTIPEGALFAFPYKDWLKTHAMPQVVILFTPNAKSTIAGVETGQDGLYVSIYENVVGSVHLFKYDATTQKWFDQRLPLPANGSPEIVSVNKYGPEACFNFESFLLPPTLFLDSGNGVLQAVKSLPAKFDTTGLSVTQYEATSVDGTKVPYFVVRKASATGPQPALLYGYGGFEIPMWPGYRAGVGKLWLEKGGTYVLANIRGGGEFGPAWHEGARLENHQHAFDDFAAVAQDLEARGLTTPKQLGIMGGSNGGLLVSAVMLQHPELFNAVVCEVPLVDMLRYTQIGAGASWIAEYGDPADPKQREFILKYSPYQNVQPGGKYPSVFFVTATSDDRVTPVHARKMAAKMEAQGHEVLYYENTDGGHSAAANHRQAAEMGALTYIYLQRQLGLGGNTSAATAAP